MRNKITTMTDADRVINDWTESYLIQPTDAQKRNAARKLVEHIGGFGMDADLENTEDFDLCAALYD